MYQSEFHKLLSIGGSTDMIATSAMDESVHRVGRPFGGCAVVWSDSLNPIRSGGGGGLKAPPQIFWPHAFNFGATILCVGDFSQKIV